MAHSRTHRVLLLAIDLSDPAVHRRVTMLKAGGAAVTVAGFRRSAEMNIEVSGCVTVDFGRTYNGRLWHRAWCVMRELVLLFWRRGLYAQQDAILARNLEMLAIGYFARAVSVPKPVLIYECLDLHKFMLRQDPIGASFRWLEGFFSRPAAALITSSPAFVANYFRPLSKVRSPVRIIENKVLALAGQGEPRNHHASATNDSAGVGEATPSLPYEIQPGPPWRIGWYGLIRCRRSLSVLSRLAEESNGLVEIMIRGRPWADQFPSFEAEIAQVPGIRYLGQYSNLKDLEELYSSVHFSWTVDFTEDNGNSALLLPNRLYEGGYYNCIPIAELRHETGRFLVRLGIGVVLNASSPDGLLKFFRELTAEQYESLRAAAGAVPKSTWAYAREDCVALVQSLDGPR
ncbi:MAG TPA: glycosyl transferase family 1 [Gemmatimonadaceae bacterium]|nr:glycosyl transferase family 1 [Gemmatimonadaceae bacterium]